MKIQRITLFQHDLPVKGGAYRMANASVTRLDSTIVRLESDCGTVGWGETCPVGPTYAPSHAEGARAALTEMAPHLIGTDLDKPVLLNRKMDSLLNGHRYAKYAGQRLKPQAYTDEERVICSPHTLGPCMVGQPGVAARAVGEAAGARAQQLDQGARRQARALPRVGHVGRERVARRRGRLALENCWLVNLVTACNPACSGLTGCSS